MTEKECVCPQNEPVYDLPQGYGGMLGLARRAGKLIMGTAAVADAVRGRKKPVLVLIDTDASQKTKSKLWGLCYAHRVPYITLRAEGVLGSATGAGTDVLAVAVTDAGFAEKLRQVSIQCPAPPADDGR